jgi:hypothetical protein
MIKYYIESRRTELSHLIGHMFRRNCLLKYIPEGRIGGGIEVTG